MISKKIKQLRQSASLTQEDISKMLGCSVATVCSYETGKVNVPYEAVKAYARYFRCHAEYLLNDEIPLMDEPNSLEKNPYISKLPVLKNLALLPTGNNVYRNIYHPLFDNAPKRKAWLMDSRDGNITIAIIKEVSNPREGDHVVAVLDGQSTVSGYYYIDENYNICIKSKPKGSKGIRNIRVGLNEKDSIVGIIELVITIEE